MKTLRKLILTVVLLLTVNSYSSQSKEYTELYNNIAPKLQKTATIKQEFYGKEFSFLYKELEKENIKVIKLFPYSIPSTTKNIRGLRLYFLNDEQSHYAYKNKFAEPFLDIVFKDNISQEIMPMGPKFNGNWNNEFYNLLSKLRIEKIKFYGVDKINDPYSNPR